MHCELLVIIGLMAVYSITGYNLGQKTATLTFISPSWYDQWIRNAIVSMVNSYPLPPSVNVEMATQVFSFQEDLWDAPILANN